MSEETLAKIGEWLKGGDVGASALALCTVALGHNQSPLPWPFDQDDFGRCYRFMQLLSEEERQKVFGDIIVNSPRWEKIVSNWDKLVYLYTHEHERYISKALKELML